MRISDVCLVQQLNQKHSELMLLKSKEVEEFI